MQVLGGSASPSGGGGGSLGGSATKASSSGAHDGLEHIKEGQLVNKFRWIDGHKQKPKDKEMSLFELESLVARRMEVLADIDQRLNAPTGTGRFQVITEVKGFVAAEIFDGIATIKADNEMNRKRGKYYPLSKAKNLPVSAPQPSTGIALKYYFDPDDEVVSHNLCRYAFCQEDKWRTWFIRTEEILFRARLEALKDRLPPKVFAAMSKAGNVPFESLPEVPENPADRTQKQESMFKQKQKVVEWTRSRSTRHVTDRHKITEENLVMLPMQLAIHLIRERRVVCINGFAVLDRDDLVEVLVTVFTTNLQRELLRCKSVRSGNQPSSDEKMKDADGTVQDERESVWAMLDAFMGHLIVNPADKVAATPLGELKPFQIPHESKMHMPPCMRAVERSLTTKGHLKHHGRWQFGLFLKSIGLSADDSVTYFAEKMVHKGGGSREVFAKSPYGYAIRHAFGQEGKRTSYTSMNCGSVIKQAPMTDTHDCHGCPFRFSNEGELRTMLSEKKVNPVNMLEVVPLQSEIEDIVKDCQGSHYTRACYKYFAATHKGAKRDQLFNSPYEMYCASKTCEDEFEETKKRLEGGTTPQGDSVGAGGASPATVGAKRDRVSIGDAGESPGAKRVRQA